jgi:formylglycine-generating enzyme required for sulfatase activity
MGRFEVTNEQFRRFLPSHHSREEDRHGYQFGITGYDVNKPKMPAVRLSWKQALGFCEWLSKKSGLKVTLPTEAQWEWACRAGSSSPFWYGEAGSDFSKFGNMGDISLSYFSGNPYQQDYVRAKYNNPQNIHDNWIPQDSRFNDGGFVSEDVGKYEANPFGLHDMHGNAAEWTLSKYIPYPYNGKNGRNDTGPAGKRVVRGGSWYDRPRRCTSSYRWGYREYQKVYNVGFRVVAEE